MTETALRGALTGVSKFPWVIPRSTDVLDNGISFLVSDALDAASNITLTIYLVYFIQLSKGVVSI